MIYLFVVKPFKTGYCMIREVGNELWLDISLILSFVMLTIQNGTYDNLDTVG